MDQEKMPQSTDAICELGAIGRRERSSNMNLQQMSCGNDIGRPQYRPGNNLSDQTQLTSKHAASLLDTIAETPSSYTMVQIHRESIVQFIHGVQHMCDMVAARDSAGLHAETELPKQLGTPAQPSQQDLVRKMERVEQEMERRLAAIEAAVNIGDRATAVASADSFRQSMARGPDTLQATQESHGLSVPGTHSFGEMDICTTGAPHSSATQCISVPVGAAFSIEPPIDRSGREIQINSQHAQATSGTVMIIRRSFNGTAETNAETCPDVSNSLTAENIAQVTQTNDSPSDRDLVTAHPQVPDDNLQASAGAVGSIATHLAPQNVVQQSSGRNGDFSANQSNTASPRNAKASLPMESIVTDANSRASINDQGTATLPCQALGNSVSSMDREGHSDSNDIASTSQTNAGSSAKTGRARHSSNNGAPNVETAVGFCQCASESMSTSPSLHNAKSDQTEDADDEDGDEDSEDSGEDSENTDEDSEDSDENSDDTEMEETAESEVSEESEASEPKPIEEWRKEISKPQTTGIPQSVRAVSPSTTIPAPPIKKITRWLRINISVRDLEFGPN
ncbi:MAG: hypothetical protein Q9169_006443 [Polycauliona sp. 2 TL-2023]